MGAMQRHPPFLLMSSKLGGISFDSLLSDQSGLRSEYCGHGAGHHVGQMAWFDAEDGGMSLD